MNISERTEGKVTVLDLQGPLALGEGEEAFRHKISELLEEKRSTILLNLGEVEFVDSSGVGALVKCLTSVTRAGGKLKGLRPNPTVVKVLPVELTFRVGMLDATFTLEGASTHEDILVTLEDTVNGLKYFE